ncbi:EF-hand domain-containing protein, partial [archaeon]
MISLAFSVLDKTGNGIIEPDDLINAYDSSKHPDVLTGKRTADDVLREFLDTFDVGGVKDGKVTREEFENYYANISASIDDDDY